MGTSGDGDSLLGGDRAIIHFAGFPRVAQNMAVYGPIFKRI
jgi:hypothetical protein